MVLLIDYKHIVDALSISLKLQNFATEKGRDGMNVLVDLDGCAVR